jgi:hypothetical protein
LPAGNIILAFAHKTFPGKPGEISSRICIIYPTTVREGITNGRFLTYNKAKANEERTRVRVERADVD